MHIHTHGGPMQIWQVRQKVGIIISREVGIIIVHDFFVMRNPVLSFSCLFSLQKCVLPILICGSLSHRNVGNEQISIFYPWKHVQPTRSSSQSHPFQVILSNPRTLSHKSSFILRTVIGSIGLSLTLHTKKKKKIGLLDLRTKERVIPPRSGY